jgi:uncharacterized protein YjbK
MHPILDSNKYMLRIREKEEHYELTLKEPKQNGNLETNIVLTKQEVTNVLNHQKIDNIIFQKLESLQIDIQEINASYVLQTLRSDSQLPLGTLSIDKNTYLNTTDYELEFEVTDYVQGKQAFLTLLDKYHLSYQNNCPSKIQRLKQALENHYR